MSLKIKILTLVILIFIIISLVYIIFFAIGTDLDGIPPSIDTITGDLTVKKGETNTIGVTFSDNVEVTNATLFYKVEGDTMWGSKSILSGEYIFQLNYKENLCYYITVDDAASNGPIGNPSNDGSICYKIKVLEDDNEEDEYIRKVFVEEASFTNCKYCPIVANMLYELYTSGSYNFYYVSLIRSNEKACDRLDNDYNLFGLPTVYVDGGYRVLLGGSTYGKSDYAQAIQDAEFRIVPDIQLKVIAEYNNNTDELISNVFVNNKENKTYNGLLRIYLTEKVSRWSGPEGEPYHFGFLNYIGEEEKLHLSTSENITFEKKMDISNLDPENLMVIAVIFNSEKNQGYSNPEDKTNPFDAYYADAVEGSELIKGGNLPPTVGLSLPEIGKLHLFGNPIYEFKIHKNTVLIGKTKIVAETEDDSGIEKVEFYINGNLVNEDTEEPYEYDFKKNKLFKRFIRKYTFHVIAYDNEGKTGVSNNVEVIGIFL